MPSHSAQRFRTVTPLLLLALLGTAACKKGPSGPQRCSGEAACPADFFCGRAGVCVSAVTAVVGGVAHSCALHKDGTVSCWGDADTAEAVGRPVVGPTVVAKLEPASALAAGQQQTCAIIKDGRIRCFGREDFLVGTDSGQPLSGVTALALGTGFGCAANDAGTHCWGRNDHGQLARPLAEMKGSSNAFLARPGSVKILGAGLAVVTLAPKPRHAAELCAWGDNSTRVVSAAEAEGAVPRPACRALLDAVDLTVGAAHACVRYDNGTFACWGERYYGQLGIATNETSDVPPTGEVTSLPAPAKQIVAGAGHTCALTNDGRVFCFGVNSLGQVSESPAVENIRSPYERRALTGQVVALGAGPAARHTCAVLKDGQVACWGSDDRGQLGDAAGGKGTGQEGRFSHGAVRVAF